MNFFNGYSLSSFKSHLNIPYVFFAFCLALFLGALKGILVGPIAALILIVGNIGVITSLLPLHVTWTVHSLFLTNRFDLTLKIVLVFVLVVVFGLWLVLGIIGSLLVGIGYGFFTPWFSAFEAFRHKGEAKTISHCIMHCVVDGTWGTIRGSCTVVRDFADFCYHSYPTYIKELREDYFLIETQTIRLIDVPACLAVGLMGLLVDIPLYTIIAIVKSPYLLFKGWYRLLHDLVSREGPFLETACVPVAGIVILLWPIFVVGSIILAILSSFFIGLYGSIVVYQENSFREGVNYVIAMVSEFDEYTNDWLYLREGSILPKPRYRKKRASNSPELESSVSAYKEEGKHLSAEPPALLVPSLAPSRSLRETLKEVKMVQIWEELMKSMEIRGIELLDANALTMEDLIEWIRRKNRDEATIINTGLPSYSLLAILLMSIKSGSRGLLLSDGTDVTQQNRPRDRLLDWFFHPIMVLKEQIRAIKMEEEEMRFLEKFTLYNGNIQRMKTWDNDSMAPHDALRTAQVQGISRRLIGMTRSISKFPTYRRRFQRVVKNLLKYQIDKENSYESKSFRSTASNEIESRSSRSVASIIEAITHSARSLTSMEILSHSNRSIASIEIV